jgi:small-conductance mechanosensitive channel
MTLLPILRNFLAVLIAAIAMMMVLPGLGIAIGSLIAGAGIFSVAIGFGSQSLVKDIISRIPATTMRAM